MYNLETYVDPSKGQYYTKVDPEKIKELVPKEFLLSTHSTEIWEKRKHIIFGSIRKKMISIS
jgi:hypothetical protein